MATQEELIEMMGEHEFLKDMPKGFLEKLAACSSMEVYYPGEYIFKTGEPAKFCYLIREGHVSIELYVSHRGAITMETLGRDKLLGWSWFVPPHQWCFDARPIELSRLLRIDAAQLQNICESDHDFGYYFMKRFLSVIAGRLHATRLQLCDMYGPQL